jgi:putative PIN family toxin of toxin-antitoxin system
MFPGGRAEETLLKIIEGKDQLILSRAILDELLTVLSRKFSRDAEQLAHLGVFLTDIAELVQPLQTLDILADEPDNRILECAIAGQADSVVTGDRAMLQLGQYQQIRIISLKEYLDIT